MLQIDFRELLAYEYFGKNAQTGLAFSGLLPSYELVESQDLVRILNDIDDCYSSLIKDDSMFEIHGDEMGPLSGSAK